MQKTQPTERTVAISCLASNRTLGFNPAILLQKTVSASVRNSEKHQCPCFPPPLLQLTGLQIEYIQFHLIKTHSQSPIPSCTWVRLSCRIFLFHFSLRNAISPCMQAWLSPLLATNIHKVAFLLKFFLQMINHIHLLFIFTGFKLRV